MAEHQIAIEEAKTDLLACAARLAESIKNSDGRSEAMKEVVPRYLEKGAVDLAAELADTVDDPFTRDRLLMLVAERCAAIDDDEYAFQLVEAIEDYGTQAQAREHIALQKSTKGDYAQALEIASALDHADYVFADIAVRQIENGGEPGGFQTLAKIEFPNAKAAALQNIALHELKKGDAAKAAQSFENAVQSAVEIEFAEEKVRALTDIGNHYVKVNQNSSAIETFDKAKAAAETIDGVHRDSLLAGIALGFLRAGSLELADRALDLVADKTQMASALVGFSQRFWEQNEPDEAVETLEEAYQILKSQREREIRDSRARYNLWATIAVEFARIEKAERAVEIAQEILDETAQTSALKQIAQICTLQNRDELARQAVAAIGDEAQKMFALIGISDAKNKLNKLDEALSVLREAETLCETLPQLASRSATFGEFAKRFHVFGDAEKARALLHENLEIISGIRDESVRVAALAQLADLHDELKFDLSAPEKEILETMLRKAEW
jgi:tetratricopeptide (TPR) repeat protein